MSANDLVKIHLYLPLALRDRLNANTWDPIRDKPSYGARSALIRKLLTQHFDKQDERAALRNPTTTAEPSP